MNNLLLKETKKIRFCILIIVTTVNVGDWRHGISEEIVLPTTETG